MKKLLSLLLVLLTLLTLTLPARADSLPRFDRLTDAVLPREDRVLPDKHALL